MDSGHPPFFGMYIAGAWKLLGKTLFVSHLALLPFILLLGFQYYKLVCNFIEGSWARTIAMLVFCLDPCLSGQFVLVSPDVILLLGFVISLRSVLENREGMLTLGLVILCLISMRGYMISAALGCFYILKLFYPKGTENPNKGRLSVLFPFVPGALIAIGFLIAHFMHAGWVGYHEDSPWADSFLLVDVQGMLKNSAIIIWRLLDFGRIFLWIPIVLFLIKWWRAKVAVTKSERGVFIILLLLAIWLLPSMLIHQYLTGHRYLLPIMLLGQLLAWISLEKLVREINTKKLLYSLVAIGIITGNFWIYSDKIAMGWDSTLAHLPYYELRIEMIEYIDEQNIDLQSIGSQFPNVLPMKYIDLSDRNERFAHQDLESQDYILYSNVFNDFSDEDIDRLQSFWVPIKKASKMGVHMTLYKRPDQ